VGFWQALDANPNPVKAAVNKIFKVTSRQLVASQGFDRYDGVREFIV
jgi:hypothetical protein